MEELVPKDVKDGLQKVIDWFNSGGKNWIEDYDTRYHLVREMCMDLYDAAKIDEHMGGCPHCGS